MDERGKSIHARLAEREKRLRSGSEGLRLLLYRLGGQEQGRIIALWKNWERIMGEEVAELGRPLGSQERILSLGADNSMALQELSLQAPEILERANLHMQSEYFKEVKVLLLQGRTGLVRPETQAADPPAPALPSFADGPPIGAHLGRLSPDSPVTRCYETIVALSRKKDSA